MIDYTWPAWEPCGRMFEPYRNLESLNAGERLREWAALLNGVRTHAVDMRKLAQEGEPLPSKVKFWLTK